MYYRGRIVHFAKVLTSVGKEKIATSQHYDDDKYSDCLMNDVSTKMSDAHTVMIRFRGLKLMMVQAWVMERESSTV